LRLSIFISRFLHASLQLQALLECTTRHELDKALEEFPAKIADVYIQTWRRIMQQPLGKALLAVNVLRWVLYATRSLSIEELRNAIASCPETHSYESGRLVAPEIIVVACCGLITIEKETRQVRLVRKFNLLGKVDDADISPRRFVDYSAKPVLQGLIVESIPYPHSQLAAVCINRLSQAGFQQSTISSREEFHSALEASPLIPYAYDSWSDHARQSLDDDSAKACTCKFVRECHSFPIPTRKYGRLHPFGPPHVAAFFDLPPSVAGPNYLQNLNLPVGDEGLTPLHLACIGNAKYAVKEMLALSKIKVNAVDRDGWTALIWASDLGHEEIVALLLTHPYIKVNQAGDGGVTALHRAAERGHTATVKILLAVPKIKPNQPLDKEESGATPLIAASFAGQEDTVRLLLGHPQIKVNMVDSLRGWSALMYAVSPAQGDGDEVVKVLLSHPQIQLDQRDRDGWTPLQVAKRYKRKGVEDILLEHYRNVGPNVSDEGGSEDTWQSSISRLVDDLSRLALPFGG
jgi:ankyrin repeat domain-containing protein 50